MRAETLWKRVELHSVIFVGAALPLGMAAYAIVADTHGDGFGGALEPIAFLPGATAGVALAARPVFATGIGVALLAVFVLVYLPRHAGWFVTSPDAG